MRRALLDYGYGLMLFVGVGLLLAAVTSVGVYGWEAIKWWHAYAGVWANRLDAILLLTPIIWIVGRKSREHGGFLKWIDSIEPPGYEDRDSLR